MNSNSIHMHDDSVAGTPYSVMTALHPISPRTSRYVTEVKILRNMPLPKALEFKDVTKCRQRSDRIMGYRQKSRLLREESSGLKVWILAHDRKASPQRYQRRGSITLESHTISGFGSSTLKSIRSDTTFPIRPDVMYATEVMPIRPSVTRTRSPLSETQKNVQSLSSKLRSQTAPVNEIISSSRGTLGGVSGSELQASPLPNSQASNIKSKGKSSRWSRGTIPNNYVTSGNSGLNGMVTTSPNDAATSPSSNAATSPSFNAATSTSFNAATSTSSTMATSSISPTMMMASNGAKSYSNNNNISQNSNKPSPFFSSISRRRSKKASAMKSSSGIGISGVGNQPIQKGISSTDLSANGVTMMRQDSGVRSPSLTSSKGLESMQDIGTALPSSATALPLPPPPPPPKIRSHLSYRRQDNMSETSAFNLALDKLCEVMPHVERPILALYLERSGGDDMKAIGLYFEDERADRVRPY